MKRTYRSRFFCDAQSMDFWLTDLSANHRDFRIENLLLAPEHPQFFLLVSWEEEG